MVTKVQSWGNSQGLRLSKQVLADAHVSVGDDVNIAVRDGVIVGHAHQADTEESESWRNSSHEFPRAISRKKPTGERGLGGRSANPHFSPPL